jgi:hypothetical protein
MGLLFLTGVKDIPSTMAQKPYRSPFRYVIVWHYVDMDQSTQTGYRNLEVLLDEKAFNEANLTELFSLLKKRFPVPRALFINVKVSLEDLPTPEEADEPQISERSDVLPGTHPTALLARNGLGEEWIRYTMNPSKSDGKRIILKGKSGQPPK